MTHLFNGLALAALVALALPSSAEAHRWHNRGWGPSPHAANDFVAGQLNRAVLGQIGLRGAVGLDQVALNPQPLPPRAGWR